MYHMSRKCLINELWYVVFSNLQSINEDSLKRLNSYLEDLQKKNPVNPTHLMFYLKNDTAATSLEEPGKLYSRLDFLQFQCVLFLEVM